MTIGRVLWDILAGAVWLTCCVRAGLTALEGLEAGDVLLWGLGAILAIGFMVSAGSRVFDVLRMEALERNLQHAQANTERAIRAHEETLGRVSELQAQLGILQEIKVRALASAQQPAPAAPPAPVTVNEQPAPDTSNRFAMLGRELVAEETKP